GGGALSSRSEKQRLAPAFLSSAYTSSENQVSLRNSKAAMWPAGRSGRKSARRARSFFRNGGSWNSTGPRLVPRLAKFRYKKDTESAALSALSRDMCVMRREALIENRNSAGVSRAQFSSTATLGI